MGFNKFTLNITVRCAFIALNAVLIAFFWIKLNWFFTLIFLCLVFFLQIYLLIRYVTKINLLLANFLVHIKEQDTSLSFPKGYMDKIFKGLSVELGNITKEFQKVKTEQIQKQNLLNILLDRVGTGILAINADSKIKLHNKAILKIFGFEDLSAKDCWAKIKETVPNISNLETGNQKIETIRIHNINRKLLIAVSEIKENNENLKIYSFHDIDREMTDYELQSWNGLIKVLSHEIMNTLTPMSTVVDTIKDCITIDGNEKEINQISKKDISDSVKGINLIDNRLNNLKGFISRFRMFSDIPTPELKNLNLSEFIKTSIDIYKSNYPKIQFIYEPLPDEIFIMADNNLLTLVFNNIIKNAAEALKEAKTPKIELKYRKNENWINIDIIDNGPGIEESVLNKIFLPFFTTKKDGSGIGLSLARQIMFMHHGNIEVDSDETGTIIRLVFQA
ncbi:MAG TPA: ATP-binding protein [Bacteroidales bacterium]|nr:ATP-binding protein [Bacteroidales bacterium]